MNAIENHENLGFRVPDDVKNHRQTPYAETFRKQLQHVVPE
jgi:hypothetical protein